MDVVIVVPTYNESGNLARMAEALLARPVPGLRLLNVDDESPDGTAGWRTNWPPRRRAG